MIGNNYLFHVRMSEILEKRFFLEKSCVGVSNLAQQIDHCRKNTTAQTLVLHLVVAAKLQVCNIICSGW